MNTATGSKYLDALGPMMGGYIGKQSGDVVRDFLMFALLMDCGVVVFEPGPTLQEGSVRSVNAAMLALLKYPDAASYAKGFLGGTFWHADDAAVVADHNSHLSSALFDARCLRGDGTYRKLRLQSMWLAPSVGGGAGPVLSVTVACAAPIVT